MKNKITKPPYLNSRQNQPQAQNYSRQVPQQASHSDFFNDQQQAAGDRSKNFPFFQQKNLTNKHFQRNQPHYTENEDYFSQNQQQFSTNQKNYEWNFDQPDLIYQPDLFESYTQKV